MVHNNDNLKQNTKSANINDMEKIERDLNSLDLNHVDQTTDINEQKCHKTIPHDQNDISRSHTEPKNIIPVKNKICTNITTDNDVNMLITEKDETPISESPGEIFNTCKTERNIAFAQDAMSNVEIYAQGTIKELIDEKTENSNINSNLIPSEDSSHIIKNMESHKNIENSSKIRNMEEITRSHENTLEIRNMEEITRSHENSSENRNIKDSGVYYSSKNISKTVKNQNNMVLNKNTKTKNIDFTSTKIDFQTEYTQNSMLKLWECPITFIKAYAQVYNSQINKKRKILFSTLNRKEDFEMKFLSMLYDENLEKYKKIEKEILKMREMEYYDSGFYLYIKELYLRSVLILIDKADTTVLETINKKNITDTHSLIENIMIFYIFTDLNIDINMLFLEKITTNFEDYLKNPKILIDKVLEFQNVLRKLNKRLRKLEVSAFISDNYFRSRIYLSMNIQGFKRMNSYNTDFLIHFINELKIYILKLEKSLAYLHVMNIKYEMSRRNMKYKCVDELIKMAEHLV